LKLKINVISDDDLIFKESYVESIINVPVTKLVLGGNIVVKHAKGELDIMLEEGHQPNDYKIIKNIVNIFYFKNYIRVYQPIMILKSMRYIMGVSMLS
jgi:hypothetical protein